MKVSKFIAVLILLIIHISCSEEKNIEKLVEESFENSKYKFTANATIQADTLYLNLNGRPLMPANTRQVDLMMMYLVYHLQPTLQKVKALKIKVHFSEKFLGENLDLNYIYSSENLAIVNNGFNKPTNLLSSIEYILANFNPEDFLILNDCLVAMDKYNNTPIDTSFINLVVNTYEANSENSLMYHKAIWLVLYCSLQSSKEFDKQKNDITFIYNKKYDDPINADCPE